jgi:hypothetical protein
MATKTPRRRGATDDPGRGGNAGLGDRPTTERDARTDDTTGIMTPADGGKMNYGGTDAAYAGMENRNEGDAGDRANATDRDDMDQPTGSTGALSGGGMTGGTEPGDGMESTTGRRPRKG